MLIQASSFHLGNCNNEQLVSVPVSILPSCSPAVARVVFQKCKAHHVTPCCKPSSGSYCLQNKIRILWPPSISPGSSSLNFPYPPATFTGIEAKNSPVLQCPRLTNPHRRPCFLISACHFLIVPALSPAHCSIQHGQERQGKKNNCYNYCQKLCSITMHCA